MQNTHYANGQPTSKMVGNTKTVFYKDGSVRAKGKSIDGKMQGKWIFYRGTGQLWIEGNMKDDLQHGSWVRYDRKDKVEYDVVFEKGKEVKDNLKTKKAKK